MPPHSSFAATDEEPPHPPRRPLKITLITLSVLLLSGVVLVFIWSARRYQQGVELAKRAQEQYDRLNREFPFRPPRPGQGVPEARWQALLRVRGRIQSQVTPQLRQTIEGVLGANSLKAPAVYRELLRAIPRLNTLLETQLIALRWEQMSAREYQWLLGRAVATVLANRHRHPAGEGYWRVLEILERLTRVGDGDRISAPAALEFFQRQYRAAAPPGEHVLAGLQSPVTTAYAIDLLLVSAQWATPEGESLTGTIKRLPPHP